MYTLHNYFRSSTSIRVRIALALKQQLYDYKAYALLKNEQRSDAYLAMNPDGLVPTLDTDYGPIAQSLAILEYLDEVHPEPPLLPDNAFARARVRSLAHAVALDTHPVNNLRVLNYLRSEFDADDTAVKSWFHHWVEKAFASMETRLARDNDTGKFCHGDNVTLADICLVSQAINNQRFEVPSENYPTINRIVDACLALPAFEQAMPMRQPDAPPR